MSVGVALSFRFSRIIEFSPNPKTTMAPPDVLYPDKSPSRMVKLAGVRPLLQDTKPVGLLPPVKDIVGLIISTIALIN